MKELAIVAVEHSISSFAKMCGLFEHRIEYRYEIAGRAIDYLQNLRDRSLLPQRFAKVFSPRPAAKARGKTDLDLVNELIEIIVKDNLYDAILGEVGEMEAA